MYRFELAKFTHKLCDGAVH